MSSLPWIKLYTDFLDDPILGRLTDSMNLCFVHLLLVAGECDAEGYLIEGGYPLTLVDLSWRLRRPPHQLEEELEILAEVGLIEKQGDLWLIGSFSKRQGRSQSAQREAWRQQKRRQRARKALEKLNAHQNNRESDDPDDYDYVNSLIDTDEITFYADDDNDNPAMPRGQDLSEPSVSARTSDTSVHPVEEEAEVEKNREVDVETTIEGQTGLAAPNPSRSGFKPDLALNSSPLSQNEAISAYTHTTGYPPGKSYYEQIVAQVTDIPLWVDTLDHWMMHGWNPRNVTGQLELYLRGGPDSCRFCPDSNCYVGTGWNRDVG
jgi:hypothetical protein